MPNAFFNLSDETRITLLKEISFDEMRHWFDEVKATVMKGLSGCKSCSKKNRRIKIFGEKLFAEDKKLNCYECNQMFFVHMLSEIVEGKGYSEIEDFQTLITNARYSIKEIKKLCFKIDNSQDSDTNNYSLYENAGSWEFRDNNIYKKTIYESISHKFEDSYSSENIDTYYWISLSEFLLNDERTKIKNCPWCGNFFTQGRTDQQYCSDKCRRDYHNKKNIESGKSKKYKAKRRLGGERKSHYTKRL